MTGLQIKRILVVHDIKEHGDLISDYLRNRHYQCQLAHSISDALAMLSDAPFDLVISSMGKEGVSGMQFMRDSKSQYSHIEFIMIAGHKGKFSCADILNAGAADFVSEPFKMEQLKARIEKIERERNILNELQNTNDALLLEARLSDFFTELLKSLISPLSFETISQLILDCATLLTSSRFGFTGYLDTTTNKFTLGWFSENALSECGIENKDAALARHSELWDWVLDRGEAILVNRPHEESRLLKIPERHAPIYRFLASPAIVSEKVIGMLMVANADVDYTDSDLKIAGSIADIYALAIQRKSAEEDLSRTYEELRAARDELAKLAEDRSKRLARAGELLKRSIETMRDITQ